MKKIINGKQYNTTTAQQIGSNSRGLPGELDYWIETLYSKRTGEYFLHGEGGAGSRYATSLGNNNWGYGERIIPLSYDQAKQWAEEHLVAEDYESEFGVITDDDSRQALNLYILSAVVETAKRAAAQSDITLSAYIEGLIVADADKER